MRGDNGAPPHPEALLLLALTVLRAVLLRLRGDTSLTRFSRNLSMDSMITASSFGTSSKDLRRWSIASKTRVSAVNDGVRVGDDDMSTRPSTIDNDFRDDIFLCSFSEPEPPEAGVPHKPPAAGVPENRLDGDRWVGEPGEFGSKLAAEGT
jgi:hypothetical protein